MAAAGLLGDVLDVVLVLNVQALLYLASGAVAYLGLRSARQQRAAVRQRATVDVG
ncbi:hypothetical protein ACLQ26_28645 [Micromonospora sp. DT43]|uniref:hypothetical protein n=1 Tax=Micromonospora sp. DT43 TaxID=3393440 RepID=UPI003CE82983